MLCLPSRRDLLKFGSALGGVRLFAQDAPDFSTAVKVVSVLTTVRDKQGQIVRDLKQEDFSLEEDGRAQPIRYFAQQSDLPLTLGLLVDTSGSEIANIDEESRASYKFFEQVMRQGEDRAFLVHFDGAVHLSKGLTASRTALESALAKFQAGTLQTSRGGTLLYEAIALSCDVIMSKQEGRKAVILLTDGDDNGSRWTLARAVEMAQRSDTLVYSIGFYGPGGGNGVSVLHTLSAQTGGGYYEVSRKMPLEKIFTQIEDELRSQYNLGYTSDKPGAGYRKIRVTVNQKSLTVRSRAGYYAR